MATMNVSLPEPMREWVKQQAERGVYANSSDYVRDLIRRDQLRAEKIQLLQAAIEQGVSSGVAEDFDMREIQRELDKE